MKLSSRPRERFNTLPQSGSPRSSCPQMPITPHQMRHALKPPRNSFYLLLPPEKSRCCLNLWCLFKCLQMQAELWLPMKISFTANLPPFLLSYIFCAWMYVSFQLHSGSYGVERVQGKSDENEGETNNF